MIPSGLERALAERDLPLADRLALRDERHDRLIARTRSALASRGLRVVSELADPYGRGSEGYLRTRVEFEGEDAASGEAPNGAVVLTSLVGGDAYAESVGVELMRQSVDPESIFRRVSARLPRVTSNDDVAVVVRARKTLPNEVRVALAEAVTTSESARAAHGALVGALEFDVTPAATAVLAALLDDTASGVPAEWAVRRAIASDG